MARPGITRGPLPTQLFFSFFFLNQLWFFDLAPFSSGPFWSVAYEFWFYALFAAAFFLALSALVRDRLTW